MLRDDGSVKSAHLPTWDNRYQIRDYGLYRGVVRSVVYPDDEYNDSGMGSPNEVLYNVMVIGGDRDGQIFENARLMRSLGGFANFEEVTLKNLEGLTKADPTSLLALADLPISEISRFNGDVVYIQFLNGDLNMPVITGMGYHQKAEAEASASDGPRYRRKFNGIYTEVTRDGEFTWSKDNGAYLPVSVNTADPLYPFVSQFAPLPGQEEAVKVTLDNEYNFLFEYLLGLNVAISGLEDSFNFATTLGTGLSITGAAEDSIQLTTKLGTMLDVAGGATDAITLGTKVGATIKIDGLGDEVSVKLKSGTSLILNTSGGIVASTATGDKLTMNQGAVSLENMGKAKLEFAPTGFIKLGNAGGDVLKDILGKLLETLSTETASGFGAPLTNVATYVQLMTQHKLITG